MKTRAATLGKAIGRRKRLFPDEFFVACGRWQRHGVVHVVHFSVQRSSSSFSCRLRLPLVPLLLLLLLPRTPCSRDGHVRQAILEVARQDQAGDAPQAWRVEHLGHQQGVFSSSRSIPRVARKSAETVLHRTRLLLLMMVVLLSLVPRSGAVAVASVVEWEAVHAAANDGAGTLEAHLLVQRAARASVPLPSSAPPPPPAAPRSDFKHRSSSGGRDGELEIIGIPSREEISIGRAAG